MDLQFFQQFVGINTVTYYSPTIIQLTGIASNKMALLLSFMTSGLNAFGSILSINSIDRTGRKKLVVISLGGVIVSLTLLTIIFRITEAHPVAISGIETAQFNNTCPDYANSMNPSSWNCMQCLKASLKCGFCAVKTDTLLPGACPVSNDITKSQCQCESRSWYTRGCPSKIGFVALSGLALYILLTRNGNCPMGCEF